MEKRVFVAIGWLVVLVLFIIAGLLLRHDLTVFRQDAAHNPIGTRAPDGTVLALDGRRMKLHSFEGQPLWLNFFATWCVPCKAEMPSIEQEYRRFHRAGLEVVGIDQQEDAKRVSAFVRPFGLSFPLVIDSGPVRDAYRVWATPTSIFVDRAGMIRAVHIGAMTSAQMETDLKKIM